MSVTERGGRALPAIRKNRDIVFNHLVLCLGTVIVCLCFLVPLALFIVCDDLTVIQLALSTATLCLFLFGIYTLRILFINIRRVRSAVEYDLVDMRKLLDMVHEYKRHCIDKSDSNIENELIDIRMQRISYI